MKKTLAIILSFALFSVLGVTYTNRMVNDLGRVVKNKYERAIDAGSPATVVIIVTVSRVDPEHEGSRQTAQFLGSGVFITSNGHILSCAHLFNHGYQIDRIDIKTATDRVAEAELLNVSEKSDLSLLKVKLEATPYVRLIDPRRLRVGDEVIAIGAPRGFEQTVTHGIISALTRDLGEGLYNLVQSDAAINPGNSGGPLLNLRGELVGINVIMISPSPFFATFTGLGFAVSPAQIWEYLVRYRGLDVTFNRRD